MDFVYQGSITAELKNKCSNRVKEIWNELQGTLPDQDFVDYVEVAYIIKHRIQKNNALKNNFFPSFIVIDNQQKVNARNFK